MRSYTLFVCCWGTHFLIFCGLFIHLSHWCVSFFCHLGGFMEPCTSAINREWTRGTRYSFFTTCEIPGTPCRYPEYDLRDCATALPCMSVLLAKMVQINTSAVMLTPSLLQKSLKGGVRTCFPNGNRFPLTYLTIRPPTIICPRTECPVGVLRIDTA